MDTLDPDFALQTH